MKGRIVLALAADEPDGPAADAAAALAHAWKADLYPVHVHPPGRAPPAAAHSAMEDLVSPTIHLLEGFDVSGTLTRSLRSEDVLVVGTGRLGTVLRLGSVAEALLRQAPCQVIIVGPRR